MARESAPAKFSKKASYYDDLMEAIESPGIDQGLIPFLRYFLRLPVTPVESCYGHFEGDKEAYLSFILDDVNNNEEQIGIQKIFFQKISELEKRIASKIGEGVMRVEIEKDELWREVPVYTIWFRIKDGAQYFEIGDRFFDIIWEEFTRSLDEII